MQDHEIREKRKQGVRLRTRGDSQPKVIQAGCDPLPGQSVVLVCGANDADEARRVYALFLSAEAYSPDELKDLRKTAPQSFLDIMDALDRVHVEACNEGATKRKEAPRG